MEDILFPHDSIRPKQEELIEDVKKAISEKRCHIAHAPTGLGKTAASLAPALKTAIDENKTVVFLTSRHTQHHIAIDTLKKIKKKFGSQLNAVDLIGRQNMCPVEGTHGLYSREFSEYCKNMREEEKCSFYTDTRQKNNTLTVRAKAKLSELKPLQPFHAEELSTYCDDLCPYELSLAMCQKANVIVTDYYYIFNESIREIFLNRIDKILEDIILIVDEAHNVPSRLRELLTQKLTSYMLNRAINEAKKFEFDEIRSYLERLQQSILQLAKGSQERIIGKIELIKEIEKLGFYQDIVHDLKTAGDQVRELQKQSSIGAIGNFLSDWLGEEAGYARILTNDDKNITISYQCLDPSLISQEVFERCYSTIFMSGTLTPTSMYKDILGFPATTTEKEYDSPFPEKNKLVVISPNVTTKFSSRSDDEFRRIAEECAKVVDNVPGNSVIFFPSYYLKKIVSGYLSTTVKKTVIEERQQLTKTEKYDMIEKFKSYSRTGAVLLAVTSGSFGEGIDLPGDDLKAAIIVGLPLQPPTLEVKELMKYYDNKFGKGWEYGYTLPAITKSLQNAGRCIRTEDDRGVIAFLDKRYTYSNYMKCFPKDWDVRVANDSGKLVTEFFGK